MSSLIENLREVIDLSRHCTSPEGGRIPTFAIKEAIERIGQLEVSLKLIADNLSEYIDKNGTVDVTVALAFETARVALSQAQKE